MLGAIGNVAQMTAGLLGNTVHGVVSAFKAPFESGDSASVSREGMLLNSLSQSSAGEVLGGGQKMNARQLQQFLQKKAMLLQKKLADICRQNNISTKDAFTLNVDKNGAIVVKGSHSQKDKLEKLLNADGNFVREFKDAKAISDFLSNLKTGSK